MLELRAAEKVPLGFLIAICVSTIHLLEIVNDGDRLFGFLLGTSLLVLLDDGVTLLDFVLVSIDLIR